jgi:hypothetical protein
MADILTEHPTMDLQAVSVLIAFFFIVKKKFILPLFFNLFLLILIADLY